MIKGENNICALNGRPGYPNTGLYQIHIKAEAGNFSLFKKYNKEGIHLFPMFSLL
jgi:hypothetical protein